MENKNASRIKLPGFGEPVNYWEAELLDRFPTAHLDEIFHKAFTVRERCMLHFVNQITDKPQWSQKVHDKSITSKWKAEALALNWAEAGIPHGDFSEDMFDCCIEELEDKATLFDETGIVPVLDMDFTVVKSDRMVSPQLKLAIQSSIKRLEEVPNHQKDWHPGSDGKVLDLVHPSLFPLIYGRSRVMPSCKIGLSDCTQHIGNGETTASPIEQSRNMEDASDFFDDDLGDHLWSHHYQWLPCNVSFPDGQHARIESYINNLHPTDHPELYHAIETIIDCAMPLWNLVYGYRPDYMENWQTHRILCSAIKAEADMPERPRADDESEELAWDLDYQWRRDKRVLIKPEPEFYPGCSIQVQDVNNKFHFLYNENELAPGSPDEQSPKENLPEDASGKQIQVIVKLANIHLTPENPRYDGSSWHIEGQLNEHICSTALYYYDNQNITDAQLTFRTTVDPESLEDLRYEQGDFDGIERIFGIQNDQAAIQDVGAVLTREDRLIAFPNVFQHKVGSFELKDKTKPGHRKILALFLVDPALPILSTANVPPQQRDWWMREIVAQGGMKDLPAELINMIKDDVDDFPIGLEEAKRIRLDLMQERNQQAEAQDHAISDYTFNFCEH